MQNKVWCVYWNDRKNNYKTYSVEVKESEDINNIWNALKVGTEQLKQQGCKIKKDYEVEVKLIEVDSEPVYHTPDF
jgi:hypothetical protein